MKTTGTKHLSDQQRLHIETMLNESYSLKDIASQLHRDPRGIKYEIVQHRILTVRENAKNKCGIQLLCKRSRLCPQCVSGRCKYCSYAKCSTLCDLFQPEPDCKRTKRFPYVCNGCDTLKECPLPKFFYKATQAHGEYQHNISDWKCGTRFDENKLKHLDYHLSQGIRNGHSIGVIINTHNLDIAPSTAYRLIDQQLLSVKNIDLKRQVKYRQRYTSKPKAKPINYEYLKERTLSDFNDYLISNPSINVWQLDTIEGIKGEKEAAVLSLLYTKTNLQLYFKINFICISEVNRIFAAIKRHLGDDVFKETFPCILTDNGKEFKDPLSIEISANTGESLTHVFYCEPRRSDQKGKCEKNHEHFRELIPKGISMNPYSHANFNYVSNQVNNYSRRLFKYKSPYEISKDFLNEKVFELNKLSSLPSEKVVLKHLIIK